MLLSGNCGCEIPAPPRTGLAGHYYNPPFRISGAYGYAPAHSLSGPTTAPIDTTAPYPISPGDTRNIVWIREVKLRSKPQYKKDLIIGKVEVNKPYKVIAATRSISANFEAQPVGKMERVFLLIAEADDPTATPIGWAIPAEHYRESETQYIDLYWAYFSDSPLAPSDMDDYNKVLKDAEALVDKLEKAKGGGGGDGSGSGSSNTPPPPPPKKKMSNTTVIMLGLGAAAAIYYFINKGQKE